MSWFTRVLQAGLVFAVLCQAYLALARGAPAPSTTPGYLGVAVATMSKDATATGAMIRDVAPDSPAAKAGLKKGDVITKIDDRDIKGPEAVVDIVKNHKAGDKVKFHVSREGKAQTFEATLGERKVETLPVPPIVGMKRPTFLGVWTQELNGELKKQLGVETEKGAVVADVFPNSPAAKAGLKKDDVIASVNGQAINDPKELQESVQKLEAGKEATFKVFRGNEAKEFKVQLQAGPIGFGRLNDFEKDFPMLKDGRFHFENFSGNPEELQKLFEEMQKRIEGLQKEKPADRSF